MIFNKNKKYSLNDIERLFSRMPLAFIIFLAFLLTVITYFILETKANRQIDLVEQKYILEYELNKKENLLKFVNEVDLEVSNNFSILENSLKKLTYKTIGYLQSNKLKDFKKVKNYLKKIEEESKIKLVIFKQEDLNILYGSNSLHYIQELIFSSKLNQSNSNVTLLYILSQGKNNLQYWRDDIKRTIRLSFFDKVNINGLEYLIGSFSSIKLIKDLTKESLIKLIKTNKSHFWFYDLYLQDIYNFKGKKKFISPIYILKDEKNNIKKSEKEYEIVRHYYNDYAYNDDYKSHTYLYSKYNYLVTSTYSKSIAKDEVNTLIEDIQKQYRNLFFQIFIYILVISAILILSTFVFTNFIKRVFSEYNFKLQKKTDSLEHWKKRFELAIIASNDGLWDINFKNNKIYFSEKWLSMFGYKEDEVSNLSSWFDLIHNEDKQAVKNIFDKIFAQKEDSIICEYRLKTKNDGFKWVFARGKAFYDEEGKLDRMLMMSMDIDKSKRMKKELLDVELLVEDGKIAIFKLNNDEKLSVKYISNSINTYGFYKKTFESGELDFIDLIYKEDINIVKVAINSALKNDLPYFTFVCRALNDAHEIRWISCRIILIKDHSGEVINFYGYINDITKIKVSQEELKIKVQNELDKNKDKDKLLIQQSKLAAMGELIGSIAHQWRQPLNNVSLMLQFLRDNYENKDVNKDLILKYFTKANVQINYMSDTIDDFRNFYKPSKSENIFNIQDAIESTIELIKEQLSDENIKLNVKVQSLEITSYENELKQSLLNILNNAKDAIISKKSIENFDSFISIEVIQEETNIKISLCNNGGEIPPEVISRIFEPYFTTKFETQGTGIGLYMTKIIIEQNMQGKIEVNNIKEGVCFDITLPLSLGEKK